MTLLGRAGPTPTRLPTAARAPCPVLHQSLHAALTPMHARRASLDRLRILPAKELRTSPASAIFSLRDARTDAWGCGRSPSPTLGVSPGVGDTRKARTPLRQGRAIVSVKIAQRARRYRPPSCMSMCIEPFCRSHV